MPASERPMRKRCLTARTALALLLAGASGAAFADFREDYAQGLKSADDGKWGDVARRMSDALEGQAAPEVQMRMYGQRFEPYVPAFFLGIALAKQGDCETAVQLLRNPATMKVVNDTRARRRLGEFKPVAEKGLADCERKLAGGATEPPKPAAPAVATPAAPTATTPPAVATTTRPATSPATRPAAPVPTPPKPAVIASNTPAPATAPPKPAVPAPAASAAPAQLATALDDFLRGRYQQVVASDPARLGDKRARFHALLLRAAARHTLAQLDGGDLSAAAADVRAAKALENSSPDSVLFSPRFRKFYADTR